MLSIYSDGASSGKPGRPGGYGWVIVRDNELVLWGMGGSPETTNNRMELSGAIAGLEAFLYCCQQGGLDRWAAVELVSDSQYVLGIANGAYNPTANLDLAAKLKELVSQIKLQLRWVKGHSGDNWNEKVDEIASAAKFNATPPELRKKKK